MCDRSHEVRLGPVYDQGREVRPELRCTTGAVMYDWSHEIYDQSRDVRLESRCMHAL
jgi:hypothetical protein